MCVIADSQETKKKTIKGKGLKGKSCAITNKTALHARAAFIEACLRTRALRSSVYISVYISSTSSMLDATPLNSTITSTERSRDDRLFAIVFLRLPCRECLPTDNESGLHLEGLPPEIDSARRRVWRSDRATCAETNATSYTCVWSRLGTAQFAKGFAVLSRGGCSMSTARLTILTQTFTPRN